MVHEIKMYAAKITSGNKSKMFIKVSDDHKVEGSMHTKCALACLKLNYSGCAPARRALIEATLPYRGDTPPNHRSTRTFLGPLFSDLRYPVRIWTGSNARSGYVCICRYSRLLVWFAVNYTREREACEGTTACRERVGCA